MTTKQGQSTTKVGQRRTRLQELTAKIRGDGCSMSPDLWFKEACDEHDVAYRYHQWINKRGDLGGPTTKARADARLWRGIKNLSPILPSGLKWLSPTAAVYWLAVTVGGKSAWRTGPSRLLDQPAPSVGDLGQGESP